MVQESEQMLFTLEERKVVTDLIGAFVTKKKDNKFFIDPNIEDSKNLTNSFCFKALPLFDYVVVRLKESKDEIDKVVLSKFQFLLRDVHFEEILRYTYKLAEGGYGCSIVTYKLNKLLEQDKEQIRKFMVMLFSMFPSKHRQMHPQTMGVGEDEFSEIEGED